MYICLFPHIIHEKTKRDCNAFLFCFFVRNKPSHFFLPESQCFLLTSSENCFSNTTCPSMPMHFT